MACPGLAFRESFIEPVRVASGRQAWNALYLSVQEGNLGYGDKRYVE